MTSFLYRIISLPAMTLLLVTAVFWVEPVELHAACVDYEDTIYLLGSNGEVQDASALSLFGSFAYIAADAGLYIVDVSDPSDPVLVGSLGMEKPAEDIDVAYPYAYVARENALEVIDVQDSMSPIRVGIYEYDYGPGWPWKEVAVAVRGTTAYFGAILWDEDDGRGKTVGMTAVLDVSDPTTPVYLRSFPGNSWEGINRLEITGDYLFSLTKSGFHQWDGVNLYDISTPSDPVWLSDVFFSDSPGAVTFAQTDGSQLAYVRTGSSLSILDWTDPHEVTLRQRYSLTSSGVNFTADDGFLFSGNVDFFESYEETEDPTDPFFLLPRTSWQTHATEIPRAFTSDVEVVGEQAYLTLARTQSREPGLKILNNIRKPTLEGRIQRLFHCTAIDLQDSHAFLLAEDDDRGWVRVVDTSQSDRPVLTDSYDADGAEDISVDGSLLYIAEGSAGLRVLNWTNGSESARVDLGSEVVSVIAEWPTVWAATRDGLAILDSGLGRKPKLRAWVPLTGEPHRIEKDGNHIYIPRPIDGLVVVDVSDPHSPKHMEFPELTGRRIAIDGDRAYLASGGNVRILDVTEPMEPMEISTFPTTCRDLASRDGVLYTVSSTRGMCIFDVVDPFAPREVGCYTNSWREDVAIELGPEWIFVSGKSGLAIRPFHCGQGRPADVETTSPRSALQLSVSPSPLSANSTLAFALENRTDVTLEAFDAQGRRLGAHFLGTLDPGRHDASLDWMFEEAVQSGVAFLQLRTSGGERQAIRTTVLQR